MTLIARAAAPTLPAWLVLTSTKRVTDESGADMAG
jgi:hypothetical protein